MRLSSLIIVVGFGLVLFSHAPVLSQANQYKIPVVSIDSVFRSSGFTGASGFGRRLTNAVSNILDSLAMDSALIYVPNYKASAKVESDFTVVGTLGLLRLGSQPKTLGYHGYVLDNFTLKSGSEFGCNARNTTDISCFCYNTRFPDSTNYKFLKGSLFSGLRVIMSLVPMHKVLSPVESEKAKASFAINKPLKASTAADKEAAKVLTQIMNNILAFNQASYKTSVKRNYKHYNYYPNYRQSSDKIMAADFVMEGVLISKGENFEIQFSFDGKDVNLVSPEELKTKVSFNKKRFLGGDYSEAMYEMTGVLYSFILMNTMF